MRRCCLAFLAPLGCLLESRLSKKTTAPLSNEAFSRIATEMATCPRCLRGFVSSQAGYRPCKPMHRLWSVFQNPAGLKRALGSYNNLGQAALFVCFYDPRLMLVSSITVIAIEILPKYVQAFKHLGTLFCCSKNSQGG